MAWSLSPGSSFVVQLHLMPTDRPEVVDFQLGLYFGDRPAVRAPVMLRLGRQDIDIAAGTNSYTIADSYVVPVDVDVEALQPHAHYLATTIRASASLPDGTTRWLLEIPNWDFHWQDVYRLQTPLRLPSGTTVTMQYTYDNSSGNRNNPTSPPMPVHYGQQTVNEMGDFWIQMLPVRLVDRPALLRSVMRKSSDEDIGGYRFLLGETPRDPLLHTGLGKAYLTTGRTAEGIAELREALRFAPESAQTHANLASALLSDGKVAEAEAHFREAVRLEPRDVFAQNGIGLILLASGQPEKAVALFRMAVQLDPNDPQGHNNLGIALQRIGRTEEAISEYRESVRLAVDSAAVTFNLANALTAQNRLEEAIETYRRTLELDPTEIRAAVALGKSLEVKRCDASAISSYRRALELAPRDISSTIRLAWLLATTPEPTWRNPREALELASRALSMSAGDPEVLDVYAAANAAAGAYEAAIQAAERALTIRGLSTSATLSADEISERLKLYRRHQPFVMTPPPALATQC